MRRARFAWLTAAAVITFSGNALAESASVILWYPGEAGTTEQAQPIIDELFSYMGKKLGNVTFTGRYHNTVDGGVDYITRSKPAVGIVSYAALAQFADRIGNPAVIMATLPLPGGRATEQYSLVSPPGQKGPPAKLISSEPLDISFVRERLFPDIPEDAVITSTDQMFQALRRIAGGEIKVAAILTPMEAESLSRLKSDWAVKLGTPERSRSVPSARLVLFDPSWPHAARLRDALTAAGRDPEAADLMIELRLKGFQKID